MGFSPKFFENSEQFSSQARKNRNPSSLFPSCQKPQIQPHLHAPTTSTVTKEENEARASSEVMVAAS